MVCKVGVQKPLAITARKQYCLAVPKAFGKTQGNIAYTQNVISKVEFVEFWFLRGYGRGTASGFDEGI
jgi:hypothetical protein